MKLLSVSYRFEPNRLFQVTWNSPITSRLLLEAGGAATISQWNMYYNPGVTNDIVSIFDLGLGSAYGAPSVYLGHPNGRDRYTQRASLSYVTGSHNFKAGFQNEQLDTNTYWHTNGNVNYYFYNGAPIGDSPVCDALSPAVERSRPTWASSARINGSLTPKLTLNLGMRWDYFNSYVPAQTAGFADDTDGYFAGPDRQSLARPAHVRSGVRRAELEGLQPEAWRRLRPVRQRQDGAQVHDRPLRGEGRAPISPRPSTRSPRR